MWFSKHKTLVMAVGIVVGAVALLLAVAWPMYQSTTTLMDNIKTKTVQRDDLANRISILSGLDPVTVQSRVDVLNAALPPNKDILLYLSALDGLSRDLNLTFGGLSLTPGDLQVASSSATKAPAPVTGLQSLETNITIQGDQENIYTFLRTVEQVLPLMQIKDLKVTTLANTQYLLSLTVGMLWAAPTPADLKGNVALFTSDEEKFFTDLSQYRQFTNIGGTTPVEGQQGTKQDLFEPIVLTTVPSGTTSAKR